MTKAPPRIDWQSHLERAAEAARPKLGKGKVADYIPALAEADPNAFAMAMITVNGSTAEVGAADEAFSIQSLSKVFTLVQALGMEGDAIWDRVGREPSGSPFNSVVQLEHEQGVPRNPFINAGAMIVTDAIVSHCGTEPAYERILKMLQDAADSGQVRIDGRVADSERKWGDRNRSLAYFMSSFGNLKNAPSTVLDAYFHQCAIEMNVRELARAGLFLANGGTDPITGREFARPSRADRINAMMMTCGHYDMSGDFAFRVGLPGKSGVGGGILAIAPGVGSIAVWSPALNKSGNSLAGTVALEAFAAETGLNVFSNKRPIRVAGERGGPTIER